MLSLSHHVAPFLKINTCKIFKSTKKFYHAIRTQLAGGMHASLHVVGGCCAFTRRNECTYDLLLTSLCVCAQRSCFNLFDGFGAKQNCHLIAVAAARVAKSMEDRRKYQPKICLFNYENNLFVSILACICRLMQFAKWVSRTAGAICHGCVARSVRVWPDSNLFHSPTPSNIQFCIGFHAGVSVQWPHSRTLSFDLFIWLNFKWNIKVNSFMGPPWIESGRRLRAHQHGVMSYKQTNAAATHLW